MATYAENLVTIRDNLVSKMVTESANPKPSYSEDGRSISWDEWWARRMADLEALELRIQRAGGPFIHRSRGRA